MAAHQAPLSLGFSRQEHWSGLPFPSPMQESEKWKWSCSAVSDSSRLYGLQPTWLLHPWDFPGKSTGVGCHRLLQSYIESESEVAQSCLTLCDPMDCSLPGFSIHGIFQARMLDWAAISYWNSVLAISFHNLKSPEEGRAKYVILGWMGMNGKELSKWSWVLFLTGI